MKDLFRKYAYHLDNLRMEANIKTKDFCDGVCEPRTYRYYISGQRVMSQKALNDFCKKLGFTAAEFYSSYNMYDNEEYQLIYKLYVDILQNRIEKARKKLITLDDKYLSNYLAKQLYEYCIIEYNHKTGLISNEGAYKLLSELIDYPNCLNKLKFTFQETVTLQAIVHLEHKINVSTSKLFLEKFLLDPNYQLISSNPQDILPAIYSTLAFYNGLEGNLEKVVLLTESGISVCKKLDTFFELDNLTYYCFLSQYKLGNEKYKKYLSMHLSTLFIKSDFEEFQSRLKVLEKDGIENPLQYLDPKYLE